jgi:hypothetical protein
MGNGSDDYRYRGERVDQDPKDGGLPGFPNPELVEELRYIAWDKCTTPSRVALAWLRAGGESVDVTLSAEEIRRLDTLNR